MATNSGFIFRSGRVCCVPGCPNREYENTSCEYYTFPGRNYEFDRKRRWIDAVREVMKDKSWMPNRNTRICSAHFVGKKKSTIAKDEAYVPTIFPETPKEMKLPEFIPVASCIESPDAEAPTSDLTDPLVEGDITMKVEQGVMHCLNGEEETLAKDSLLIKYEEELIISDDELDKNSEACIVDSDEDTSKSNLTFSDEEICTITEVCGADTEDNPLKSKIKISIEKIDAIIESCKAGIDENLSKFKFKSKCRELCKMGEEPIRQVNLSDASISPVELSNKNAETCPSINLCTSGEDNLCEDSLDKGKSHEIQSSLGLEGGADENALRQLAGVSAYTFRTLLKLQEGREHMSRVNLHDNSDGTQVRMFVIHEYKQQIRLEYAMLLFLLKIKCGLSFSDLGRTFNVLPRTAAKVFLIFLYVLADCTKSCICWPLEGSLNNDNYPSIACIEIPVDTPKRIKPRIWTYSGREGVSTVKFLIAITSVGVICKVSKVFGGRVSNEYIAINDCKFSNFRGHEVLDGRRPCAKVQVQYAIDRVKSNRILKDISMSMVHHLNDIAHMCCVFANSQLPLAK